MLFTTVFCWHKMPCIFVLHGRDFRPMKLLISRHVLRHFFRTCTKEQKRTHNSALTCNEVRDTFINYFKQRRQHSYWHSSSVCPSDDDSSILFTNAGMNQFKPLFLGAESNSDMNSLVRVVNTQKCIRAGGKHNDLNDVGKDGYHHTFFEMLGNWSFGDYFKKEACLWAWELLTDVYKIPSDRLYVTYFGGNEEANLPADTECRDIWLSLGVAADRLLPFGMKDNFWEMARVGPCGPCSEIHYDRVGDRCAKHLVNSNDPNVVEIWNLVFIQFNRESNGDLQVLPTKHIDCGLGLERLVAVIQNKSSNYDTDVFLPLFSAIQARTGVRPYQGLMSTADTEGIDMAYRVVADHARALAVCLSDGVKFHKASRGYVLRKIMRRGVRIATEKLKAQPGLFTSLVPVVVDCLGDTFPELRKGQQSTMNAIDAEEALILENMNSGRKLFQKTIAHLPSHSTVLPGKVAFRLWKEFGFPIDLIELMAAERGLQVDMVQYEQLRDRKRTAPRKKMKFSEG